MIARTHRFHGHGSLRHAYQHGKTVRGPFCSLKYVRNDRRDSYRAAVVVSKKVHKSAVVRNRIRRRIYEVVRQAMATPEPYDLIFNVYNDHLADCSQAELAKVIGDELRTAGLVRRGNADQQPTQ